MVKVRVCVIYWGGTTEAGIKSVVGRIILKSLALRVSDAVNTEVMAQWVFVQVRVHSLLGWGGLSQGALLKSGVGIPEREAGGDVQQEGRRHCQPGAEMQSAWQQMYVPRDVTGFYVMMDDQLFALYSNADVKCLPFWKACTCLNGDLDIVMNVFSLI